MDGYYKNNMSLEDKLYLAQVKDEKTLNKVIEQYKKEGEYFIDKVKEIRSTLPPWSDAINKTSLSKKDITLYSDDQLITSPDGYLFDFGDIDFLLSRKVNPYTGDHFPSKFINYLQDLKKDRRYLIRIYPLDISLRGLIEPDTWCPDVRFMRINSTNTVYFSKPLVPCDFKDDIYMTSLFYDKRPWNENYVYKITLKKSKNVNQTTNPYNKNIEVKKNEIASVQLIHDPTQFSPPYEGKPSISLNDEMIKGIFGYHNTMDGKRRYIRPNTIDLFKKNKFHEQKPMKLYRGLQVSGRFFNNLETVKVGDTIYLPTNQISSWTTNRCVAEKYSMFSSPKGIVVSSVIDPSDMILDSRFIRQEDYAKYNKKDNNTLFWQYQNEILVKPGNYPLKVESILYRPFVEMAPYQIFTNEQYRSDLLEGWDQYYKTRKSVKPKHIKSKQVKPKSPVKHVKPKSPVKPKSLRKSRKVPRKSKSPHKTRKVPRKSRKVPRKPKSPRQVSRNSKSSRKVPRKSKSSRKSRSPKRFHRKK